MNHDTVYRLLADSGDGLVQILIYVVVGTIVVLGNISKARAERKRSRRTGNVRPQPKPSDQRMDSQAPHSGPEKLEGQEAPSERPPRPKYYAPGGFAEALLDETLEKTLQSRRRAKEPAAALQPSSQSAASRAGYYLAEPEEELKRTNTMQEDAAVMDHDLDGMGQLETLDKQPATLLDSDDSYAVADLISFESTDDATRAVVYAEILGKPVGLR